MSKECVRLYQERDAFELDKACGFYSRHVMAMTSEQLHSKSAIAAELGHRDMRIDKLEKELQALRSILADPVIIPREMTDDIGEAIVREAHCCGGIAYSIYEAIIAVVKEPFKNTPLTQEEIDILQTDILTLCKRIKDAYEEGLLDKQWNQEVQTDEQLWNASSTKRIYDALIKQAMEQ